ncbi:phosphatase PAP2 family protein [Streptomyces angustmyceticus]|uniref:Phosphatase PAP2 family protein n=1 Tax=Streptomyces angustmyceticus TaxID=285578 RepID=A0A5J4LCX4_9ACTN|nr:phosphatase PAP2 family protein [Streptomyces angustmyceticus]UAL67008.1 phosphatase PAP2 family protein [Streptomyces angustmyceticus]GES32147.1 phosphatase PAP2 family protein [Streptomyces angustmyceticus]
MSAAAASSQVTAVSQVVDGRGADPLALGGASIDGGPYLWITGLVRHVPHGLNTLVSYWSDYGLVLFAVLMLIGWWRARNGGSGAMALALAAPVVVIAAFLVDDLVKALFGEERPCRTLAAATLQPCPGPGDWSFPSNHATLAAAAAVALLLCDRQLGRIAVPAALLMAASRVWVGAHYPHDAVAGLAVGALVARGLIPLARRAAPAVDRIRASRLRPLVAAR